MSRYLQKFLRLYRAAKSTTVVQKSQGKTAAQACLALHELTCQGGDFLHEQAWRDAAINWYQVRDELFDLRRDWLASNDGNTADAIVELKISGNKLVGLLNALDQFAYAAKPGDWWQDCDTRCAADTLRDILCKARIDQRKVA